MNHPKDNDRIEITSNVLINDFGEEIRPQIPSKGSLKHFGEQSKSIASSSKKQPLDILVEENDEEEPHFSGFQFGDVANRQSINVKEEQLSTHVDIERAEESDSDQSGFSTIIVSDESRPPSPKRVPVVLKTTTVNQKAKISNMNRSKENQCPRISERDPRKENEARGRGENVGLRRTRSQSRNALKNYDQNQV